MRKLPAGNIKRIHVAQPIIRARKPNPLRVKVSHFNEEADEIRIIHDGEVVATIMYRPENPLSCGARVWIETTAAVEIETNSVETPS